ncbi:MAG: lamin tail domain-containing protein [Deltaproteobacteria bacterium]|nr:lamin tail domain-containing protein [Deltaproteobacteria bacterium]
MLLLSLLVACGVQDKAPEPVAVYLNELDAGGDPDWVELYNAGDAPLDLSALALSDGDEPWSLSGVIAAGAFAVIDCDGGEAGAPFKLSGDGETLSLHDSLGDVIDAVAFPAAEGGLTWGRIPDGSGAWAPTLPTPGSANAVGGAGCAGVPAELVLNELLSGGETADFVELVNTGDSCLDLAGLYLSDDADALDAFPLPALTLEAGAFTVIWADQGEGDDHAPFKLSSGGEDVFLSDADGAILATVALPALEADTSWGRLPDGTGAFQRTAPTPGEANRALAGCSGALSEVVINELLSSGATADYIELFNGGSACVSLGGAHLSDALDALDAFTFPEGLALEPGELALVWADDSSAADHAPFKLSSGGEDVYFSDADQEIVETVALPALEADTSWGRLPDGAGAFQVTVPTPGALNQAPEACVADPALSTVVINEGFSNGSTTADFVELFNAGDSCMDVSGYHLSDDPEDLSAYALPADAVLASGGLLVVWADAGTDPYHAPFKLSAGGEEVFLTGPAEEAVESLALPALDEDVSWGRVPDGGASFALTVPTPGATNQE